MEKKIKLKQEESIFDFYFVQSKSDIEFSWQKPQEKINFEPEEVIFDGNMIELNPLIGKLLTHYYILLKDKLLRVLDKNQSQIESFIPLQFTRLELGKNKTNNEYSIKLSSRKKKLCLNFENMQDFKNWFRAFRRVCILPKIEIEYEFKMQTKKGSISIIHLATSNLKKHEVMIKSYPKKRLLESFRILNAMANEINILRDLKNRNHFQRLYEVYESTNFVHLVFENIEGEDLFSLLEKKGLFSEKEAAEIILKLLIIVDYLHSNKIIHRDIKPENIYYKSENNQIQLKLTEFGLATKKIDLKPELVRCGTPGFMAPEIFEKIGYDDKVDIFSIGILTYVLLTGSSPFLAKNHDDLIEQNKGCNLNFNPEKLEGRTIDSIEFIKRLTMKDPKLRPSVKECMKDLWFTVNHSDFKAVTKASDKINKYVSEYDVSKLKASIISSRNPTINQFSSLIEIPQNKNFSLFDRSVTTNFEKKDQHNLMEEDKLKINIIHSNDDYIDDIPDENENGKNNYDIKRSLTNSINLLSPNFDANNILKNFKSSDSPVIFPSVKSLSSMDEFSASKDKLSNSTHFKGFKKH